MNNIIKARKIIKDKKVDGLLLTSRYNKGYLAGLFSGSGYVFITDISQHIIVDFRYYEQVKKQNQNFNIILANNFIDVCKAINYIVKTESIKKIGFEGNDVTFNLYKLFDNYLNCRFISINLSALRAVKNPDEINNIKIASNLADKAYSHILEYIEIGMTELELENELVSKIKAIGGKKESFDIIVASGIRGSIPHGKASHKTIQDGDFVTIDFGIIYKNYCSDITRTFAVGYNYSKKLKEIYDIVLKAQTTAIDNIKEGITASDIDSIARNIINDAGYGKFFKHNTGHGLGLLVHEYPVISPDSDAILKEGMIITIEPGIYIPELGGVRIEDDVLVTKNGYEVLSKSNKSFYIVA